MKRALILLAIVLTGCTRYYQVHDPLTHRTYYTNEVKPKDGTITFRDASTGADVTIQNAETKEVTREEFDTGRTSMGAGAHR